MKQLILKNILLNLFFLSFIGCTPIYYIFNKSEVDSNRVAISELSEIFKKRPLEFLKRVKLDTVLLAHDIDSLGFGFVIEKGTYRYNNQISFGMQIIRKDDSVYSYSVEPFVGHVFLDGVNLYKPNYEKAGWRLKDWDTFYDRFYNYDFTTLPVTFNSHYKPNIHHIINYLMTPYSGYTIEYEIKSLRLKDIFNSISQSLNQDDIYYLLHSLNPATRAIVIKFVKCSKDTFNDEINNRIDFLINNSPQVRTHSGCFIEYEDLAKIVKCF